MNSPAVILRILVSLASLSFFACAFTIAPTIFFVKTIPAFGLAGCREVSRGCGPSRLARAGAGSPAWDASGAPARPAWDAPNRRNDVVVPAQWRFSILLVTKSTSRRGFKV